MARRPWTVRRLRRKARRAFRQVPPAVWVIAALATAGAVASGCHPVGSPVADLVVTGLFAAVVVLVGAHAPWPALFWAGCVVLAVGGSTPARLAGAVVVVSVVVLDRRDRLEPAASAAAMAVVLQVVLRLPTGGRLGTSALLAALAVVPAVGTGARRLPRVLVRPVARLAMATGGLVLVAVAVAAVVALQGRSGLEAAQRDVERGVDAAQVGDTQAAADAFRSASVRFARVHERTGAWWTAPAAVVPLVAQHLDALDDVARAGGDGAALALDGATEIDPDRLRLVDGRIDPDAVTAYQPTFHRLAADATSLRKRAGELGSPWLVGPVQDRLDEFRGSVAKAEASARTADAAAQVAPAILGAGGRRTYLLAFVTPAEARASGGFLGNYGVLVVDDGRLDLTEVGRNDQLDAAGDPAAKAITGPDDYVARYGRFDPAHTWANVTMSPDFPSVAQAMAELFPRSGGVAVDGVIRLDPVALGALLELTGPVTVPGLPAPLDATNAAPFLLADQYALFDDQAQRSDLLGDVARAAFDQLTTGSAAPPARFGAALGPSLASGDLALWFRDPAEQQVVVHLGADDGLPAVSGPDGDRDLFGVTTQNAAGNKVDVFLQRDVRYRVRLDTARGRAVTDVTITLRNDAPRGGYPDYVIGNLVGLPPGTNRSYVSFFSTQALTSATIDGEPLGVVPGTERGLAVSSAFVDLAPETTRTIRLTLSGPVDLSSGHYRFAYVPQVVVRPDRVTWQLEARGPGRIDDVAATGGGAPAEVTTGDGTVQVAHPGSVGPWSVDVGLDAPS